MSVSFIMIVFVWIYFFPLKVLIDDKRAKPCDQESIR